MLPDHNKSFHINGHVFFMSLRLPHSSFLLNFPSTREPYRCAQTCDEKELKLMTDIKTQIKDKEHVFFDMEAYLPKKNG